MRKVWQKEVCYPNSPPPNVDRVTLATVLEGVREGRVEMGRTSGSFIRGVLQPPLPQDPGIRCQRNQLCCGHRRLGEELQVLGLPNPPPQPEAT